MPNISFSFSFVDIVESQIIPRTIVGEIHKSTCIAEMPSIRLPAAQTYLENGLMPGGQTSQLQSKQM